MSRAGWRRKGFTLVETLVVVILGTFLLGTAWYVFRSMSAGAGRGIDTLAVLQGESSFLGYLKHDLRTLIMDGRLIPPPIVESDAKGTFRLSFYAVQSVNDVGQPLPAKVEYVREAATRPGRRLDGCPVDVFTLQRTCLGRRQHPFLANQVTRFQFDLLDRGGQPLAPTEFLKAQKARIILETTGSELLQVTTSIYSPYLTNEVASSPTPFWVYNWQLQPITPGAVVRTFNGVEVSPSALEIIPGAKGLALVEEW